MPTTMFPKLSKSHRRWAQFGLLAGLAGVITWVIAQTVTASPLVQLATEPLYMNGAKTKGNLSIALSVEFPTVGQTYRDTTFDITQEYVGYFDPLACYKYVPASGSIGAYFDWQGAMGANGDCGGNGFNGNFMNWATSSAIDIMRYGLTGGNRVIDESNGNARTVVERAYLPPFFYRDTSYFNAKSVPKSVANKVVPSAVANKLSSTLWIFNCRNRLYLATQDDTSSGATACDNPFGSNADTNPSSKLVGPSSSKAYFEVRNLVCDPNSASNRLMTYDPATREWHGLCKRYPSGKYKPVGQFQVNADNLRVSVFGYLNDDDKARYGGVMRAPMKYLGPNAYDQSFNLIAGTNPRTEWDATTGVFLANPQSGDATYGDQGFGQSGAINYINKFGTLHTAAAHQGDYKTFDPVTELYYEVLRYLQGKTATANAFNGVTGNAATDKDLKENFPAYQTWTNPFSGFTDSTGTGPSCLRNSILAIADVNTHADWSVPGNTVTSSGNDFARAADTNPALDAMAWTKVVGGFESNTAVNYTDSRGRSQTTAALAGNTVYNGSAPAPANIDLRNMQNIVTGATFGSYAMAGLAYFANTQTFNSAYPKARVSTFTIDVNENNNEGGASKLDYRHTRQLYLAAKYGGFNDDAADNTGNPYQPGSNILWQGSDGEANNYFLVSDAKKFLDGIATVFARVVAETGSIAGGAISTTRLTSADAAAVYQARFNPVANYWSGRLLKYPISLAADGNSIILGATPTWEAGDTLTDRTKLDNGANRTIVIGPPIGRQGTDSPATFSWSSLPTAHQTALNTAPDGTTDTLGSLRLNWLRGDQTQEQSARNPSGQFRPRDIVLGDIVNSGIVFVGKPTLNTPGADFRSFYNTNKNRRSVLYVNANDGMLHGFYDDTGQEAFAYIPGFLSPLLSKLPDQDYLHIGLADATPAISDALVGSTWKTVLVSGVGGGAQGVYALDVTDPSTFGPGKVMWEFTDRDHAAMGNVLGAPQILKFRTNASSAATPTYKYYAVIASGVNNYAADGYQYASGNPSIFLLDLAFVPSNTTGGSWQEGVNFWRLELPQTDTTLAKGLVSFSVVKNPASNAVDLLYAGDMQGNMWKLDFTTDGTSSLGTNAATNFQTFNKLASDVPMFVAQVGSARQPITGEPVVVNGFNGQKVLVFGTGKFLETPLDVQVPMSPTASFYSILDTGTVLGATSTVAISRSDLVTGTLTTSAGGTGTVTVPSFTWGMASGQNEGWVFDFTSSIGERQISDITALGGKILFGSIFPTTGSCGEGGGRLYVMDPLNGNATLEDSQVGVLAAPLVVNLGSTALTLSDETGQRTASERLGVITQGSKGLKPSTLTSSYSFQVGRVSWRQLNNFQANKAAP